MHKTIAAALIFTVFTLSFPLQAVGEEGDAVQPGYYELTPSLIANLKSGGKYVRADIQFMSLDPEMVASIELHAPTLRHELLMLMADQEGEKLKTAEGKEELRHAAMDLSRKTMRSLIGKSAIDELFFTAFFVQ